MRAARVESGSLSDMPDDHRERIALRWPAGGSMITPLASISSMCELTSHKGDRRALVDDDLQPVGQQPHHRCRLHPGNLFQLLLALLQRNKEDVAIDVAGHHLQHLRAADIAVAGDWMLSLESTRKRQDCVRVMMKQ